MAENNAEQRIRGRPFPKGVSGNPGGRPKGLIAAIKAKVGDDGEEIVKRLWDIARGEATIENQRMTSTGEPFTEVIHPSFSEQTKALDSLADRGFGKAASSTEVRVSGQIDHDHVHQLVAPETLRAMTDEEKLALVAASKALRAARARALPENTIDAEIVEPMPTAHASISAANASGHAESGAFRRDPACGEPDRARLEGAAVAENVPDRAALGSIGRESTQQIPISTTAAPSLVTTECREDAPEDDFFAGEE